MATGAGERFVALDGLRGIAALSVVMVHLESSGLYPDFANNPAVDLFFIMSGFVIEAAYSKRMPALGVRRFLEIRLIRLYPTWALSLLIIPLFLTFIKLISTVPVDNTHVWLSLPLQALYLPSPPAWVPGVNSAFLLNGPGWSLLWEMVINLLYALFFRFLSSRVLAGVVAAAGIGLILLWWLGQDVEGGAAWNNFHVGPVRVLFGFPLGVLFYRMKRPGFSTPFTLLLAIGAAGLFIPKILGVLVAMPLLVWLATGSIVAGAAEQRILLFLGELSYPLYAVHTPMFAPLGWIWSRIFRLEPGIGQGIFELVGACVAAWLVLIWWDQPVRKHLGQWRRRRLATAPAPA